MNAVAHPAPPVGIIGTAAACGVKKLAGDVGEVNLAGIFVFKLDQAAAPASVAKALPFGGG